MKKGIIITIIIIGIIILGAVGFYVYYYYLSGPSEEDTSVKELGELKQPTNINLLESGENKIGAIPVVEEEKIEVIDSDNDSLSDELEAEMGTDPNNRDTDGDGIDDPYEENWGTDPLLFDTDSDGYSDGVEVRSGFDPLN